MEMDCIINDILPEKEDGFPAKVSLSSTNATKKKKRTRTMSGQEKLKISPIYQSLVEIRKRGSTLFLTKLADGRQIQTLTFSAP